MLITKQNFTLKEKKEIAILISCFNRKEKTLACLESVFSQKTTNVSLIIFLIDCGSDGTSNIVKAKFPDVKVFIGDKFLYWASSMRKLWKIVLESPIKFNFYLLLNDDTILFETALAELLNDFNSLKKRNAILIGSTMDPLTKNLTYGGRLLKNGYDCAVTKVIPNGQSPQLCHLGNGNIMLIPIEVFTVLGTLSHRYSHGLADFDYTLRARKAGIETFIGSNFTGICNDDHGNNWWPSEKFTLQQRIKNLYDLKGLAYKEYLIYLKKHFPYYLPQAWLQLWAKTLFPILWEKFKKDRKINS